MGKKWEEQTDAFDVEDEAGNIYRVVQYTEFEDVSSFGQPKQRAELLSRHETTDGDHVNRLSDDKFEILAFEKVRAKRVE